MTAAGHSHQHTNPSHSIASAVVPRDDDVDFFLSGIVLYMIYSKPLERREISTQHRHHVRSRCSYECFHSALTLGWLDPLPLPGLKGWAPCLRGQSVREDRSLFPREECSMPLVSLAVLAFHHQCLCSQLPPAAVRPENQILLLDK